MAKNEVFKDAEGLSLPVATGVKSGTALRIGILNAVAQTDEGSVTNANYVFAGIAQPTGGIGNAAGFATVKTTGAWSVPVTGALNIGDAVFYHPQIGAPVLTLGVTSTAGGTLAAATYFWKVTAIDAGGETVGSNEVTATTTGTTSSQPLSWPAIAGSTGFKVYRGTAAGAENTLVATLGAVTSYTDTGAAGTAATVPAANTATAAGLTTTSTGNFVWGSALRSKTAPVASVIVRIINSGQTVASA